MPFVKHTDSADGGNGVATNCDDFIQNKLIPFATSATLFPSASNRWTLERTDNIGANERELFISPPSNAPDAPVIAFHTRDSGAFIFAGTSYAGGVESYALPGNTRQYPEDVANAPDWSPDGTKACSWTNEWPTAGLLAHWLFAPNNGAYIYAVIQLAARRYRHIMFGQYDKFSTALVGGEFFGAMFWDQAVSEIDVPYQNNRKHSGTLISQTASGGTHPYVTAMFRAVGLRVGSAEPDAEWHSNGAGAVGTFFPQANVARPNGAGWDTANNSVIDLGRCCCNALGPHAGAEYFFNIRQSLIANVKALAPLTIWALGYSAGVDKWMAVGQLPDVFGINMQGFSPNQELSIGGATYTLFPVTNSDVINTQAGEEYSGYSGFAVRQRP